MRRRPLLAAVAAAAAGCVAPATSTRPTTASDDGTTRTGDDGDAVLSIRVVNDAGARRTVTVEATHAATPPCRFEEPACGAPTRETSLVEETATLSAGGSRRYVARATLTDGASDTVAVAASTGCGDADELAGLAAGDAAPDTGSYVWRLALRRYDLLVRLGAGVTVTVGD